MYGYEAMMQTDAVLKHKQQVRLHTVTFEKALVLEERKDTKIMLTLATFAGVKDSWYNRVVRSFVAGSWVDHCKSQVRMAKGTDMSATAAEITSLQHATPAALWYRSMSDVSYNFSKTFRKLHPVAATSGSRQRKAQVDLSFRGAASKVVSTPFSCPQSSTMLSSRRTQIC